MTGEPDHKDTLKRCGITRVETLLPPTDVIKARNLIYARAVDYGLYTGSSWQRSTVRFGLPKAFRKALKALSASQAFPKLIQNDVIQFVETLVEDPVTLLPPGQQILFTLPDSDRWSVPHDIWHLDTPRLGPLGPPGLQMFICLDDVPPGGGGTLVVAGSHRLLNDVGELRSRDLKRRLAQFDYFKHLFSSEREPMTSLEETKGTADGIDLEVVELSGKAGDVYLMDLRTLHTPAPNASDKARIMLTGRLPRSAITSKLIHH